MTEQTWSWSRPLLWWTWMVDSAEDLPTQVTWPDNFTSWSGRIILWLEILLDRQKVWSPSQIPFTQLTRDESCWRERNRTIPSPMRFHGLALEAKQFIVKPRKSEQKKVCNSSHTCRRGQWQLRRETTVGSRLPLPCEESCVWRPGERRTCPCLQGFDPP